MNSQAIHDISALASVIVRSIGAGIEIATKCARMQCSNCLHKLDRNFKRKASCTLHTLAQGPPSFHTDRLDWQCPSHLPLVLRAQDKLVSHTVEVLVIIWWNAGQQILPVPTNIFLVVGCRWSRGDVHHAGRSWAIVSCFDRVAHL